MSQTRFNSKSNTVPFQQLTDDEVISLVNHALSSGNAMHTTTYKYAFFKSLLDNVFNVNLDTMKLSYDCLALRFTEIYWNLVLKYHIRQQVPTKQHEMTSVEKELSLFCGKYGFPFNDKDTIFPFESLRSDLQLEIVKLIRTVMLRYVVAAFCGDTDDKFYHFDKVNDKEGITLHKDVYTALVKYKTIFEKQNYYEWIKYLEKANKEEDSYALASKLDSSTERSNLTAYRDILEDFDKPRCFYCGRPLQEDKKKDPVDHFIPWSFVKDDKLWNFVLACPHCNSKKSNILPDKQYFDTIKERNSKLVNVDNPLVKQDFKNYTYARLEEMLHSAVFNGFEYGWRG